MNDDWHWNANRLSSQVFIERNHNFHDITADQGPTRPQDPICKLKQAQVLPL